MSKLKPVIVIADEDHVVRLVRFALEGEGKITSDSIRAFFSPEPVDPQQLIGLAEKYGLHRRAEVRAGTTGTADELSGLVPGADALLFRRAEVTADVLEAANGLTLVQRLGGRPEGIDIAAALRLGIAVSCVPRRTLAYTAEHAILLMLAVAKQIIVADAVCRNGGFERSRVQPVANVAYNWPGLENLGGLWGRTLGIIGMGEVGTMVASRARAFGMRVIYTKPTRLPQTAETELGVEYAAFDDLLSASDFVSVHARAVPETRGLIGTAALARMKPSAILINTSRGALVDETALAEALEHGRIAGAGLDTHAIEPRPVPDRISRLPNVVMTPHVAGGSRTGLLDEIEVLLANCHAALTGEGTIAFPVAPGT